MTVNKAWLSSKVWRAEAVNRLQASSRNRSVAVNSPEGLETGSVLRSQCYYLITEMQYNCCSCYNNTERLHLVLSSRVYMQPDNPLIIRLIAELE